MLATLAQTQPGQVDLARKAVSEAISAGQMDLALQLARQIPAEKLTGEVRLLLTADELRRNRTGARAGVACRVRRQQCARLPVAVGDGLGGAERGDMDKALQTIDQISVNSPIGPLRAEQHAFILLKFRKTADAEPFARRAIGVGRS